MTIIKTTISIFIVCCIIKSYSYSQQVEWMNDLEKAKAKAFNEKKLLMILIGLNKYYHQSLVEDAKNNPRVGISITKLPPQPIFNQISMINLSRKFICVSSATESILHKKYAIMQKAVVFLDDNYNEVYIEDFKSNEKLGQAIQYLPSDATEIKTKYKALKENPDSVELLQSIADLLQSYQSPTLSNKYYSRLLDYRSISNDMDKVDYINTHMALNFLLLEDYDEAIDILEERFKKAPNSKERPLQLLIMVRCYLNDNDYDEAVDYYTTLSKEFPEDQYTKWAKMHIENYQKK